MSMLSLRSVFRAFGGNSVLQGVDLDVPAGTISGLVGPNGAGKTTLFNVISGMIRPDAGEISFLGRRIEASAVWQIAQAGLVRSFQISKGFPSLTVLENFCLYAPNQPGEGLVEGVIGTSRSRQAECETTQAAIRLAERLALTSVLDRKASEISGGQKKLLELGRAVMARPKLILLDEPVAGVNPTLRQALMRHIRELAAEGITFLIVEHDMRFIAELCDPVTVMIQGRNHITAPFEAIRDNAEVQDAYLGRRR